jgi:hypothetical protein
MAVVNCQCAAVGTQLADGCALSVTLKIGRGVPHCHESRGGIARRELPSRELSDPELPDAELPDPELPNPELPTSRDSVTRQQ